MFALRLRCGCFLVGFRGVTVDAGMLLLLGLLLMLLDRSCAAPATREVYKMPQSALKGKLALLA